MSPDEWLVIGMIIALFVLLAVGIPVALALALAGFVFGYLGFGEFLFRLVPARIYGVVTNYTLMAIPLFIFMGVMLERSRIAEQLLDAVGRAAGGMRGGMAIAIIFVGVLMGASTGIVGATVVTLTLLTLPVLLRRGYDPGLACGTLCASGTLGQIIPPSLVLILLADITGQSVGTLFAGALLPGLMLALLYIAYIAFVAWRSPSRAPAVPLEERQGYSAGQRVWELLVSVLPPLALIIAVLGAIIGGVAAPTEAASLGALGSIVVVALYGRLSFRLLGEVAASTARVTGMIFFILISAQVFALAFRGLGGEELVKDLFALLPGEELAAVIFMMLLLFVLGFFLEWIEISYVALPMFLPIFRDYGVDMVWLSILISVNLQTSFLTPPFGWALFFLKGSAPPEVTTGMIYQGVIPFIGLQLLGVVLLLCFPAIATWLPQAIGW